MSGFDVLDKGCGGINVQVYLGFRVIEVVTSYLCVSVPVLDDDCGAFIRFVFDDSIIDDKLGVCVSGGIVVGVSGLFLWVAGGFLCRVLCVSVLSLSRLCMISLG